MHGKDAIVLYTSKKGTTKKFAGSIAEYLQSLNISTILVSESQFDPSVHASAKYWFLGCWTRGRFLMFQRPVKNWIQAVEQICFGQNAKIVLFTTYNIRVGSMFRSMRQHLPVTGNMLVPELKSRKGLLTENDKLIISKFVKQE